MHDLKRGKLFKHRPNLGDPIGNELRVIREGIDERHMRGHPLRAIWRVRTAHEIDGGLRLGNRDDDDRGRHPQNLWR